MKERGVQRRAAEAAAWRNRAGSAAAVGAYLLCAAWLLPDAADRSRLHYMVVITIGYGHLVGATLLSGPRIRRALRSRGVERWLGRHSRAAFPSVVGAACAAALLLLALYALALQHAPAVFLLLLAVSTWHTVENDLALPSIHAGPGSATHLPRSLDPHLAATGLAALVLAAAAASLSDAELATLMGGANEVGSPAPLVTSLVVPARALAALCGALLILRERQPATVRFGMAMIAASALLPNDLAQMNGPTFGDVFAATSLYHLASWIGLALARNRRPRRGRSALAVLIFVHALPMALCCMLLFLQHLPGIASLAAGYFSPSVYLFWSSLHVLHTVLIRELAPPSSAPSAQSAQSALLAPDGGSRSIVESQYQ